MAVFLFAAYTAWAVDPHTLITQYGHTAWRTLDGLVNTPGAITQTSDGYIWITTSSGLVRFDGVKFTPWTSPKGQSPPHGFTYLLGARDGSLWIGTSDGLSHLKDGAFFNYKTTPKSPGISAIMEDHAGTIWVTRYRINDGMGPLCRVTGTTLQCYGEKDGIPSRYGLGLAEDSAGNIWFGGNVLCRWTPNSSSVYFEQELKHTAGYGVVGVATGHSASVWASLDATGPELGVRHYSNGKWAGYVVPGFNGTTVRSETLFVDRNQSLWVGTESHGLYRIHDGVADHYGSANGLSGNSIGFIYEDREGNLWVATEGGLDFFRDMPVVTFSTNQGLIGSNIQSILALSNGAVWVGNEEALDIIHTGGVSALAAGHGLPGQDVQAMFEDSTGRIWLGIDDTVMTYKDGRFSEVKRSDGSPSGHIAAATAFAEDVEGNIWVVAYSNVLNQHHLLRIKGQRLEKDMDADNFIHKALFLAADRDAGIWIGSDDGKLARYSNGNVQTVSLGKGDSAVVTYSLFVDSDNAVLAATNQGLYRWKNGRLSLMDSRNGLPCSYFSSAIEDNYGSFWLAAKCGLLRISASDWATWLKVPEGKVSVKVFDALDGARPHGGGSEQPIVSKSPNGRLWFAGGTILQTVDPSRTDANPIPPPVHIEEVIADRRNYQPGGEVRLPARTRDLEIDYTALSFVIPQKVRFRYKLEGRDADWQEPGTRRQAFYTDLQPGNYSFHVIASNNDGIWNEEGAVLDFSIPPAFYQTTWFRVACGAAFLALLWAIYQLRVQQLHRQFSIGVEARVNERTRIARELHDTLLQTFHGLMSQFQAVRNLMPRRPDEAMRSLDDAINDTEKALEASRDAIQNLRSEPRMDSDLAESLTATGQELAASYKENQDAPTFHVILEGERRDLSPLLHDEVCRIVREVLRNAFRHAQAHRIETEIRYDAHQLRLRIRDDGKGIDPKVLTEGGIAGHWGLTGIRERALQIGAQLVFWSEAGVGTEVQLTVPAAVAYETSHDRPRFKLSRSARTHEHRS